MNPLSNVGFARLFFGDAAIVLLLLNRGRHRIVARVFGASREDSNLVTVVAVGSAAVAVHGAAARVRRIRVRPSLSDSAIGAGLLRETALGIAGEPSRTVPFFGGLIALALVGTSARPVVRGVIHSTRGSARGVITAPLRLRAYARGRYGSQ
jgi:hypothetical protein